MHPHAILRPYFWILAPLLAAALILLWSRSAAAGVG